MKRVLSLILLSSCTLISSGEAPPSAKGKQYQIRFQTKNWDERADKRSDYVFINKDDGRILLSNSFCNEFQEQSLEELAAKTFRTVDAYREGKGGYTTFHNREAYRHEGTGEVDGVKVSLKILNTRRNNCYFDFVAITPEMVKDKTDKAFDQFLESVKFK